MASEIEREFDKIEAKGAWDMEFMNLKRRCDQEARDKQHTLEASKALDNRRHNRYRDVNPYDHSRILLSRCAATDTDYINANLVKCERAHRQYILTQGPLPLTVPHFWLMAWEQKSKAILMLNKLVEKKAVKCHKYWPEEIGAQYKMQLTDVQLAVEYVKYEEFDHFSIRTLLLTDTSPTSPTAGETRTIFQFHYTTWPDFGIPSSPEDFLRFLKMVRDSGAMEPSVGPVIVHCSAGIGRSGTFCLVDCILRMLEQNQKHEGAAETATVSVSDVLSELRSYRMGLIQTPDQLFFSYRAIIEGVKYFNDEDWCNTPISSTIKYCENGSAEQLQQQQEDDDAPPPLPPPRQESLTTTANAVELPAEGGGGNNHSKWSQQPLPMIPIEEHDDDDDGSAASETDVESCDSDNDDEENGNEREEHLRAEEEGSNGVRRQIEDQDDNRGDGDNLTANPEKKMKRDVDGEEEEEPMSTEDTTTAAQGRSPEATLRRRAREEKHQIMADKVMDIKRKQREVEDGVVAAKKRRSLLVKITLAAVLIGFVCICYSRK